MPTSTAGEVLRGQPPADASVVCRTASGIRFDHDGKVVEHWDVLRVIPSSSTNNNGMF